MCIDNSRSFSAIKKIKICLIQGTDRFAKSMEKALIERIGAEKLNAEFVKQLAVVMYEPYIPYNKEYAKLESHYINEQLNGIEMVSW